jgi:hypothetical protein
MKDADATSSSGFEDRADIGVEVGTASGSEAVGDLVEDDGGARVQGDIEPWRTSVYGYYGHRAMQRRDAA